MMRLCFVCGFCMRHCDCSEEVQKPYEAEPGESCAECDVE